MPIGAGTADVARTRTDSTGARQASALDASLRLVAELAEAMSGQVQRALRQIDGAASVSLPSRATKALGAETGALERECRALRERLGLEELSATALTPLPSRRAYAPGTRVANRADAARTLALELRALGIGRDEVANRLVNTFEVDDPEGIVDSAFVEP